MWVGMIQWEVNESVCRLLISVAGNRPAPQEVRHRTFLFIRAAGVFICPLLKPGDVIFNYKPYIILRARRRPFK